jgi:hypothetical protein
MHATCLTYPIFLKVIILISFEEYILWNSSNSPSPRYLISLAPFRGIYFSIWSERTCCRYLTTDRIIVLHNHFLINIARVVAWNISWTCVISETSWWLSKIARLCISSRIHMPESWVLEAWHDLSMIWWGLPWDAWEHGEMNRLSCILMHWLRC